MEFSYSIVKYWTIYREYQSILCFPTVSIDPSKRYYRPIFRIMSTIFVMINSYRIFLFFSVQLCPTLNPECSCIGSIQTYLRCTCPFSCFLIYKDNEKKISEKRFGSFWKEQCIRSFKQNYCKKT